MTSSPDRGGRQMLCDNKGNGQQNYAKLCDFILLAYNYRRPIFYIKSHLWTATTVYTFLWQQDWIALITEQQWSESVSVYNWIPNFTVLICCCMLVFLILLQRTKKQVIICSMQIPVRVVFNGSTFNKLCKFLQLNENKFSSS